MQVNNNFKIIDIPVLLIVFNRPETTKIVLERIRQVKPEKLYVFADGPRISKPGEVILCNEVREIVKNIDWECKPEFSFEKTNLGCKDAVTKAITWAFQTEEYLIIIEDDVVPAPNFFNFAEEMLIKYRNDHRIAIISANNYTPIATSEGGDYLFSKYGHIWGWATWKRIWDKFDVDVQDLEAVIDTGLSGQSNLTKKEKNYLLKYFKSLKIKIQTKKINTWDHQFFYFRIKNNLLSIIPRTNLATNIGIEGTHTRKKNYSHNRQIDESYGVKNHPRLVKCNQEYDIYHFKTHIDQKKKSYLKRILQGIKNFS